MRTGDIIDPFEPWNITESSFDIETNQRDETVFAVGNGYIGICGNFEEGIEDAAAGIEAVRAANLFSVGIGDPVTLGAADAVLPSTRELSWARLNELFGK